MLSSCVIEDDEVAMSVESAFGLGSNNIGVIGDVVRALSVGLWVFPRLAVNISIKRTFGPH